MYTVSLYKMQCTLHACYNTVPNTLSTLQCSVLVQTTVILSISCQGIQWSIINSSPAHTTRTSRAHVVWACTFRTVHTAQ